MRTATIIRRLAAAAESRSFSSKRWCCYHGHGHGNGHGPVNLFPSMLLAPVMTTSGSFAQGRMTSIESMRSARHISSSSISADTISAPEPDKQKRPIISKNGAINNQIIALGQDGKWKDIMILCKKQNQHFNGVNYATVLSQLSRIRNVRKDDPFFEDFLDDLTGKLHARGIAWIGKARTLATMVHAIAKMGLTSSSIAMKVMKLLDDGGTAKWFIDNANPQEIANCVWACAKIGVHPMNLFRGLDERAQWFVHNGTPQAVANCVWACGKLRIESPNLFRLLDENAQWMFENGNPQEVGNCVWACCKLEIVAPNLFRLLDERAAWFVYNGSPQDIANCVWACSKLGIESPDLFRFLEERAEWLFENGKAQDIATCVCACGTLEIESPNLFRLLDEHAQWVLEDGTPQAVADCAWACNTLGIGAPNLFRLLDKYR